MARGLRRPKSEGLKWNPGPRRPMAGDRARDHRLRGSRSPRLSPRAAQGRSLRSSRAFLFVFVQEKAKAMGRAVVCSGPSSDEGLQARPSGMGYPGAASDWTVGVGMGPGSRKALGSSPAPAREPGRRCQSPCNPRGTGASLPSKEGSPAPVLPRAQEGAERDQRQQRGAPPPSPPPQHRGPEKPWLAGSVSRTHCVSVEGLGGVLRGGL